MDQALLVITRILGLAARLADGIRQGNIPSRSELRRELLDIAGDDSVTEWADNAIAEFDVAIGAAGEG